MTNLPVRIKLIDSFPNFNSEKFDMDEYNKDFHSFNVIIKAKTKSISCPLHWGPLSVKCARRGVEYYSSRNSFFAVDPRTYLLFNEGKMYSSYIDSVEEVESFTLNFSPYFAKSVIHSLQCKGSASLDDPFFIPDADFYFTEKLYLFEECIRYLFDSIHSLSTDHNRNNEEINTLLARVLENLMLIQNKTNEEINSLENLKLGTRMELFKRLTRAKDFIYSSFNRNINLAEVADVACLNQFYFLRQFKKVFKQTPHQFLTHRRLEVAASMLESDSKPVSEICCEVGFSDPSSFSKLFKRRFGVTPLRFRGHLKWQR